MYRNRKITLNVEIYFDSAIVTAVISKGKIKPSNDEIVGRYFQFLRLSDYSSFLFKYLGMLGILY